MQLCRGPRDWWSCAYVCVPALTFTTPDHLLGSPNLTTLLLQPADGDAEELRIVFTHIDAADPQRPFAFGVYVDDDDLYAGALESRLGQDLIGSYNRRADRQHCCIDLLANVEC